MLTAGALLPPLLGLYGLSEGLLWRIAAILFGLPMLLLLSSYPHRRRKAAGRGPPPAVFAVFVVLGSAVIVVMGVCVWAGIQDAAAAYITALIVNFFTTAFAFVTALDVIMAQPVDGTK